MKDVRKSTPWQVVLLAVVIIPAILISWVQTVSSEQAPSSSLAPSSVAKPSRIIVVDDSTYAPFSYLDLNGKPAGINIDVWKLWSRKTGIEVEFRLMEWEAALASVQNGSADVVGSLFKTENREKVFDFSRSFFTITTSLFFRQEIRGIKRIEDLHGFPVGVVRGDSAEDLLRKHSPNALLLRYSSAEKLIRAAIEGEIKVFLLDSETARFYLAKLDRQNIFKETVTPVAVNASYAAVKKGNEGGLALVQSGFDQISQQEINTIIDTWAGKSPPGRISWSAVQFLGVMVAVILTIILLWNINLRKTVAKALHEVEQQHRELRDSETRFRALFDLSPFSCVVTDLQGRFLMVNHAFCSRLGMKEEEVIGHTAEEQGFSFHESTTETLIKELEDGREIINREVIFTAPSRGPRYALLSSRLLELGGEKLVFVSTMDITERKLSEEALRDSENRFTRLFESAPIPMAFASDIDSYRATTWNDVWYRTFGYDRKEAEGKSGADIGLWVDPDERRRFIDATKLQSHGAEINAQLRRRDGEIRHCQVFGRFIGRTNHQILMAVYLDITERELAEGALRESEERFSKAFRSSPAPMTISDIETSRFLDCNEKWIRLIGYPKERMIGNTAIGLGIWKYPEVRKQLVAQLCRDGFVRDYAIEVITAAAETRDVMWSAEIVNLGGTEVMLSLVYDYTDRKRAEMDKEKLQLQLVQAQKMESVGRLAGGVAHDYNNMLGVILGHAELALLKSDESNPLYRHIEEIINAAKRSAELTQQLLAFARRQTIAPKVMDLNAAVPTTLQMLRWLIGENIEVVFLPGEGTCPVKIDPSQLDQILVNLCVNARDAIAGIGRISIETQEISLDDSIHSSMSYDVLPGEYVLLTVNDSGFGMDKETQAKIFEPFFTTKEMGQGTGLGLATVYGIVKQNLGYINVYSEPGRGTTFRIYLPRHAGQIMEVRKTDMEEITATHGETILMVEDEVDLLQINATMLTDLGYTVRAASTPTEALRLGEAYASRIDLLMTDVVMPEMNGRELQQLLQQSNPGIACLFMSGYTANVISHHGVLDNGVSFIQKPFTLRDMAGKVREVLDQST